MTQIESLKTEQKFKRTEAGEIPVEWEVVKIEDCCDILDSERIPLNDEERRDIKGEYPYYGANGVVDWINKHIFDEDLILMAEDGGYFDQYETRTIAYLVNGKCWVNNHAHVLRARKGWVREWIFYSIVHKNILPYIGGGTRSKLNQKELRAILIPAPPLPEQKKIAEILLAIDSAIEKSDQLIEKKKELKKGLMQELFKCGVRSSEFGVRKLKKTPIGEIPVDWEVESLGCISTEIYRYPTYYNIKYVEKGIPEIRGELIKPNGTLETDMSLYRFISEETAAQFPRTRMREGDFVISVRGTMGKVGIVPKNLDGANMTANLIRISPDKNKVHPSWLQQVFISDKFQEQLDAASSSSTIKTIKASELEALNFAIPALPEQKKIAVILSNVDAEIEQEVNEKEKLEQLKKGLMQALLTGKVRVKI